MNINKMSNTKITIPKPPEDFKNIAASGGDTIIDQIINNAKESPLRKEKIQEEDNNVQEIQPIIENPNPPPVEEDLTEKRKLINQIRSYQLSIFGKQIQQYVSIPPILESLSNEELNKIIEDITFFLETRSNQRVIGQIASVTLLAYEKFAINHLGWDCAGLQNILMRNQEFIELLEEVRLKYAHNFKIPVEMRILLMVFQTSKSLAEQKTLNEEIQKKCKSAPIPKELYNEFKDL